MRLSSVEALVIRVPGEWSAFSSRATPGVRADGSPPTLQTALVSVTTAEGLSGWGEADAATAPEVVAAIVETLLKPFLQGMDFHGSHGEIESLWDRMYNLMRDCGQTGGFMLDAISAVDMALWDLAARHAGKSIARFIAGEAARSEVETYAAHLPGATAAERLERAAELEEAGVSRFKVVHSAEWKETLAEFDRLAALPGSPKVAVDARWRLDPEQAAALCWEVDLRGAAWLENPFPPEDPLMHAQLAARVSTPVAIGECLHSHFELAPFFRAHAMRIVEPDLGRCGITEGLRIARYAQEFGLRVIPHLAPSLGPLFAATLQFAAAVPNCVLVPHLPGLSECSADFISPSPRLKDGCYPVPDGPGLGVQVEEPDVRLVEVG